MALPLKTGADLYNQQLIRARLQNLGAQPNTADVGLGQVYFNTGTNTAASLRIGYCYETGSVPKFHHVANLEDVNRLEELISALSGSSSESVASVLGRVVTLEGYFSNGKAKDADLLDGHNSDYFATATTVNDLLEDYESFKAVFEDNSDDYINTWTEVKNFLDGIKNTEDLNAILLGINTELGNKANKATTLAGYGITDAVYWSDNISPANNASLFNKIGYGYKGSGWYSDGPIITFGINNNYRATIQVDNYGSVWWQKTINGETSSWRRFLDDNNYASELDTRYLQLTGGIVANTSNAPLKIKTNSESAWVGIEYLNNLGEREGSIGVYGGKPIFVPAALDKIWTILHSGNYSDLITDLNGNLSIKGRLLVKGATDDGSSALAVNGHARTTALTISSALYINRDWMSGKMNDANNSGLSINTTAEAVSFSVWNKAGVLASDSLLKLDTSRKATIEGDLYVTGHIIADGQVSSGGIGSEGSGSGASGIVILEDWEKYDDTLAQVLGAGLGVGLRDKIAALESKATNVSVAQTLTSGKEIGAITIDGVATKLYAPSTYAWSEITSKPISLGGYGIIDAVRLLSSQQGNYAIKTHLPAVLVGYNGEEKEGINGDYGILNIPVWSANTESSYYATQIYSAPNGANLTWRQVTASTNGAWKRLLDDSNYESIVGNKFLKLSGGTLTDSVMVNHSSGSKGYLLLTNGASIGGLVTNGTAVELFNVNGYGIGVEGTSDVYVLTDWVKKTMLHAGNYENIVGNKFLKLSGGTLTGALYIEGGYDSKLIFNNTDTDTNYNQILFQQDGSLYGVLGTTMDGVLHWNYFPILNSSNIGDYAFVPRTHIMDNTDADTLLTNGVYLNATGNGSGNSNFPKAYSILMTFAQSSNYAAQLSVAPNAVHIRRKLDTWSAWKELAFTDSTVAAAKVLVSELGGLVLKAENNNRLTDWQGIQMYESGETGITSYTKYSLFGSSDGDVATVIQGGALIALKTASLERLWVNSSGNVTIGRSDLAGTDYKLRVDGKLRAQLINIEGGNEINGVDNNGGAAALCLNWSSAGNVILAYGGGNVGIGTTNANAKLAVDGTANIFSRLLVNGAIDNGSTGLQVIGGAHIQGDIANHLSNILTSGVGTWAKGHFAVNSSGARLGGFGFLVGENSYLNYLFLGLYGNEWLKINAYESIFEVSAKLNAGALIPSGQTLKIGDAVLSWDSTANALKVNKNFHSDGQVSSGGVAEEGTGGATGGSGLDRVPFTIPVNTTSFTCEHNLGTREISVSIYEEGNDFQQVLADVYLDSDNTARIVFGAATGVAHKVVIIG